MHTSMKRITQLLLLVLLLTAFRSLENPCGVMIPRGGDQDWGVGVCLIPMNTNLPIYDKSSLESIGYLTRTEPSTILLFDQKGNELEQISGHDIEYIGHFELTFLQVERIPNNDSYCLINWKSEEHQYAIKKSDLHNIFAFSNKQKAIVQFV